MRNMAKVLIIEDDRFLASAYRFAFENEKLEVDIAYDGQEGLEKIKTFQPCCIVLDLIMPKVDGFQVLEQLRVSEATSKIPVIVASNLGQDSEIKKAMDLGAKAFITKSQTPITEVISKVQSLCT